MVRIGDVTPWMTALTFVTALWKGARARKLLPEMLLVGRGAVLVCLSSCPISRQHSAGTR